MALLEINRNDIIWSMGQMDPTCTRKDRMKPILFCYWDLSQYKKWMPPSPNGMDYLYDPIFKMAASEVKLCFRLLLHI